MDGIKTLLAMFPRLHIERDFMSKAQFSRFIAVFYMSDPFIQWGFTRNLLGPVTFYALLSVHWVK